MNLASGNGKNEKKEKIFYYESVLQLSLNSIVWYSNDIGMV